MEDFKDEVWEDLEDEVLERDEHYVLLDDDGVEVKYNPCLAQLWISGPPESAKLLGEIAEILDLHLFGGSDFIEEKDKWTVSALILPNEWPEVLKKLESEFILQWVPRS